MDFNDYDNSKVIETPFVITPEALSASQRSLAEEYKKLTGNHGVLVGAALGRSEWDVRPLLLEAGRVKILRVSDPQKEVPPEFVSGLRKAYHLYSSHQNGTADEFGIMNNSAIWQIRPFYQQTLADISSFQKATLGMHPDELARKLFYIVSLLTKNDIIHGHISFANISVDAESCNLLDFCFALLNKDNLSGVAPELLSDGKITPAVDIYGMGVVFKELLAHSLNAEQKEMVQCMCDENPSRRPNLELIEKVLFNANYTSSYPLSSNILNSAEMKLGRVLGDNVVVVPEAEGATKDESFDDLSSIPANSSATVLVNVDQDETSLSDGSASSAKDKDRSQVKKATKNDGSYWWLILVAIAAFAIFFYRSDSSEPEFEPEEILTRAQYEEYWQMNIPSQMSYTADAAADGVVPAQLTILKDAMSGVQRAGVSDFLLKKFFDPRWEAQLTPLDRKAAFQLSLDNTLLRKKHKMPPLEKLHPGILYAIISVWDITKDHPELNAISVEKLAGLPAPLGTSFQALSPELSVGDLVVRAVAKVLDGDRSPGVLSVFFGTSKNVDTLVERIGYIRSDHKVDDKVIFDSLRRKNTVAYPLITWFDGGTVVDWKGKDASLKLDILTAGFLKYETLKLEDYADLLTFPINEVRAIAAAKILTKFVPKNNQPTIKLLADGQLKFSRKQIINFVSILPLKPKSQYRLFEEWFEAKPNAADVVAILISRKDIPDDMFNITAIRYLKDRQLLISNDMLRQLVTHRESLVRVLAYSYLKPSDPVQLRILMSAYKNEKEPRLKAQLKAKAADYGITL